MNPNGYTYFFLLVGFAIIGGVVLVHIGVSPSGILFCGIGIGSLCLGLANRR